LSCSVKILTVNTHKGFTVFNRRFILHELREAVRAVAADVVFLQEVQGEHQRRSRKHLQLWPVEPHYEFMADSIWPEFAYGRNAIYPEGHHGNALMSKFPIISWDNHDISVNRFEKRGLLHCKLDMMSGDLPLHAICVHLGLREGHRQQQLALLCKLVERIPMEEPVVVAGDFNDWRGKAERLMYGCGLTDVFVEEFGAAPKTFPALFPLLRLERIYVRGVSSFSPIRLPNRPWAHLSDHAPLASEIEL
jgi:endonuclease/exonuclease/phosphatase family metal-dependent hydrolase